MSSNATPGPREQFCASCGAVIKERATLCPECGADNDGGHSGPSEFHYCESCGTHIQSDPELCPECGVRQRPDTDSRFEGANVILWLLGGIVILVSLGEITSPGGNPLTSILTGLVFLLLGALALPPVHQRLGSFDRRHSLTTFGQTKSVENYPVSRYEGSCAVCDGPVESGSRREYAKELVAFGVVLSTDESGSNVYCQRCAVIESDPASGNLSPDASPTGATEGTTAPDVADAVEDGEGESTAEDRPEFSSLERSEE